MSEQASAADADVAAPVDAPDGTASAGAHGPGAAGGPASAGHAGLADALRGVEVRTWAELGRTRLPVGRAVGLPAGSVVELDRAPEDPVDVFVAGVRFATGRLVVDELGEWAVRIDRVLDGAAPAARVAAAAPAEA